MANSFVCPVLLSERNVTTYLNRINQLNFVMDAQFSVRKKLRSEVLRRLQLSYLCRVNGHTRYCRIVRGANKWYT